MAKALFKPLPLNSSELFPVNIFEKIPKNHPVHLINDVVDKLDISKIMAEYKGGGSTAFAPRITSFKSPLAQVLAKHHLH